MEKTLVLIKPDVVERGFIGDIISIYEKKGLNIIAMRMVQPDISLAKLHYEEHEGREYFERLIKFITRSPLVALVIEGKNVVEIVRRVNGNKDPLKQDMGSIRGKFALSETENSVHSSDSPGHAKREIKIWFPEL
ncbi:MAG: nucleoside-diphosphate kinase [Clostridiaceae bacterium]